MIALTPTPATIAVSPTAGVFLCMTALSLMILWILPHGHRHQLQKIGTYHHELSHGLAAMITGGRFHRFHVHREGGGVCLTSGGHHPTITSAGYVGTVLMGAVLLAQSANHGTLIVTLQIIAVALALSVLKAGDLHTASIGLLVSAVLALSTSIWPSAIGTRFMMNLVGVILICQGARALAVLLRVSDEPGRSGSDAEAMAAMTGQHPRTWALAFVATAAVIVLFTFFTILRG